MEQNSRGLSELTVNHKFVCFERFLNEYQVYFGFTLQRFMINSQSSCHFLNQWDTKPKAIDVLLARVLPRLTLITCVCSNSDWFIALFTLVVIDRSDERF